MNENLIPFNEMPPERHRELSARGGKASGESKRRNIARRERIVEMMAEIAMREDMADEIMQAVKDIRKRERRRQRDRERKQTRRAHS